MGQTKSKRGRSSVRRGKLRKDVSKRSQTVAVRQVPAQAKKALAVDVVLPPEMLVLFSGCVNKDVVAKYTGG